MLRKRIAIDLGTANTLVWVAGEGLIANDVPLVHETKIDDRCEVESDMRFHFTFGDLVDQNILVEVDGELISYRELQMKGRYTSLLVAIKKLAGEIGVNNA